MAISSEFQTTNGETPLALITGAGKRIGAAMASALASDGYQVAIHYNRSQSEAESLADKIAEAGHLRPFLVSADLSEPDVGETIFRQLPNVPSILVNNASLFEEDQIGQLDQDLWERQINVNLRAPALLTDSLKRHLPSGQNALIVNMSDAKLAAPNPDFFSYTISKYGLAGLTELSARALAAHNIRVNAIAPSVTLVSGPQSRENFQQAHVYNPLKRGVLVDDLVRALRFIVETSTITGQTLSIESGQRFLALPRDVAYMIDA